MKNLNNYINEAWSGVKRQSIKVEIEAWCENISIKRYTINNKGEIDVDRFVNLFRKDFKELPYKFGKVKDFFTLQNCRYLTSLKNCPDFVKESFSCSLCPQLDSLERCPIYVGWNFYCRNCKRKFTKEEVQSLCNVKKTKICV